MMWVYRSSDSTKDENRVSQGGGGGGTRALWNGFVWGGNLGRKKSGDGDSSGESHQLGGPGEIRVDIEWSSQNAASSSRDWFDETGRGQSFDSCRGWQAVERQIEHGFRK